MKSRSIIHHSTNRPGKVEVMRGHPASNYSAPGTTHRFGGAVDSPRKSHGALKSRGVKRVSPNADAGRKR